MRREKKFYIHSFKYTIFFKDLLSFIYLFNEIFCIGEYRNNGGEQNYVDVGANIGLTILYYYYFNKNSKISAFEPEEENFAYLTKNIKINNIPNVTFYKVALTDKKQKSIKFYKITDGVQSLGSALTLNQNLKHVVEFVKTDKLSNYIQEKSKYIIKIDTEGAEYAIINDLISSRKIQNVKTILFESHYFTSKEIQSYRNLLSRLKRIGKVTSFKNSKITEMNVWLNKENM